jgi:hypothetical protein
MRYLKHFKLFESIDDSDFMITLSDDDIKDIFMEIIDLGYEFNISKFYLTDKGSTFKTKAGINRFNPIISIRLDKYIDDNYGDSTNWDGSIYYEDRQELLDTLTDSVGRLRSMVGDSGKVSVAFRSISDIIIRISLPLQETEGYSFEKIDEVLVKLLRKYIGVNNEADFTNIINLYQTDLSGSTHLHSRSFDITPIFDRSSTDVEEPTTPGDFIISKMLTDNVDDNMSQLNSIFGVILREFFDNVNKIYTGCKSLSIPGRNYNTYEIRSKDGDLILTIDYWFEPIKEGNIFIGKKSLFKKRKSIFIQIFKLDVKVKYNRG